MRRFLGCLLALSTTVVSSQVSGQEAGGPQVKKLAVPGAQASQLAGALSMQYREIPGVSITHDKRTDQLVVMAPAETQRNIARDVNQLIANQQSQATASGVQMVSGTPGEPLQVRLANISWREFEDGLHHVAGQNVPVTTSRNGERASFQLTTAPLTGTTVEVDRRGNSVTVIAPQPKLKGWQDIIRSLDKMPVAAGETTEIMRLQNAEPAPIQRAIRLLREIETAGGNDVAVINGKNYQTAVFQGDAAAAQPADAPADEAVGGAGVIGDTEIQFVPELGVIIVKGAKRDVARVQEVIAEIERNAEVTQPDIEVRQLEHADSNAVATLLQQLYEDVLSARTGEVSITALDAPNALLLIGRKEAIANVLDLVIKIDQPVSESDRLRVFRLQNASAIDAETTIQGFFTAQPGGNEDQRPGLGFRVRVIADYRTNSLIVSASPRDMNEVTRLVNELDVRDIAAQSEIKIFPLSNARAEDLAPTLQSAINGDGESTTNENATRPSTTLQMTTIGDNGEETLDSGILSGAVVTADANANSVVVRAPAASMPLIAELIRQLDKSPGIDSLVKVFTVNNGDASQLTATLQSLFGDDAATAGTAVGAGNLGNLASSTASDSSLVPLRFSTDIRTNSIIASGSAEDLEVAESILLRLDSEGFAERITEVIWLRHQIADNIATAITNYVNTRTQSANQIQQYQQGLGPFDLPDRDLIVVAEAQSNSLLLSVSPRLYEDVRRLIDQLDRRPPMVLIKTIIAEVTLDDRFEIGGEVGLQDSLLFDRGVAAVPQVSSAPGFNFNGNGSSNLNTVGSGTVASQALSTFGVGTTSTAAGVGGFVLSAASESVSMLFRTLQTAGRLQIISRPQIMTLDNTEALIQLGQQVARPADVNVNNNTTSIGINEEDVGLILRVSPRVGADGLIVMNIDATRSAVNNTDPGQVIGIFNGAPVTVQPIDKIFAQSTINAYSGQTVVFGGLIQKTRGNVTRRVPWISNIPLLGYMFKYDQEVEERTELLVVMTPMLINGDQDLEYVKATESSRMSWCLADVVEAHGDVGLSGGYGLWGPATGATIYPDLQPTVDDILIDERVIGDVPVGESLGGNAAPVRSLNSRTPVTQASSVTTPRAGQMTQPASVPVRTAPVYQAPAAGGQAPAPAMIPTGTLPAATQTGVAPQGTQANSNEIPALPAPFRTASAPMPAGQSAPAAASGFMMPSSMEPAATAATPAMQPSAVMPVSATEPSTAAASQTRVPAISPRSWIR